MKLSSLSAILFSVCILGTACSEKKGPAERAGENIDDAAKKAADAIEEAGDKIKNSVDNNKK